MDSLHGPTDHNPNGYDAGGYHCWGRDIDSNAHQQMRNACALPISLRAALMPDAHLGYGLPIGGVLATDNAVIPYAVGVDIACRVRLSVYDLPASVIHNRSHPARFISSRGRV